MMHLFKIIVAATGGTSAMTAYSYLVSETKDRNFEEPKLLGNMLYKLVQSNEKTAYSTGWLLHYAVGIFFTLIYQRLLYKQRIYANVNNGFAVGLATGIFAAVVWRITFLLHPAPPIVDQRRFYSQLIIAHIIFGTVAILLLKGKVKYKSKKPHQIQPVIAQQER